MKKLLFCISVLSVLGAASCKKDEKKSVNNWTLDGKNYTVLSAYSTMGAMAVTDASGNGCTFDFEGETNAPAAGSYKVVAPELGVGAGPGEVVIMATKAGSAVGYLSTDANTQSATVTVNGGKITVSVPEITLKNMSGGTDEVKFSASSITQTN